MLKRFRMLPIHPQWLLSAREERRALGRVLKPLRGRVLDIGCAGGRLRRYFSSEIKYIGLDYPDTALALYATRPDLYADARHLPIATASVDAVVLKDVLEHVPEPQCALDECARVLRDGGKMVIWVPFIYPIHDAPYDFQRFTEHGLITCLDLAGFEVEYLQGQLKPVETAALLGSLALADIMETILTKYRVFVFLLPLLVLGVLIVNVLGKLIGLLPAGTFMPAFYRMQAVRRSRLSKDEGA
ncbi:hypothetical protein BTJ49_01605 [Oleiagrimonas sp. MCCC 1A03011]|nr:hypothetical protein BTJ49_01605 [Oleiagrimonas sp. MCCC 1A03011]